MFKQYKYSEIDNVVFELLNEKAAIISTDTIIGILCKNTNLIYSLKNRSKNKQIITFLPSISYLSNLNKEQTKFLEQFWPGPVSIIKDGISYRIPNDKYLLYILSKIGVAYCSSANISKQKPIKKTIDANKVFNKNKFFHNLVIVEGSTINELPSTIVNIDTWKIIREGVMISEVKEFIEKLNNKKINILVDKQLSSKIKLIKSSINYDSKISILSEKKIKEIVNSDLLNNNDLLIITKKSSLFDELSNKEKFVRSGIVYNIELAELLKKHDNTNVAIFDWDLFSINEIIEQINIYLNTTFEGGRHEQRVQTIINYEKENN